MSDRKDRKTADRSVDDNRLEQFVDSFGSFNRVINTLQRQYIELKDEFTSQNESLAAANQKLISLTHRNLAATEFLNCILQSLSAGVIAVDESGQVTHFNRCASMLLGIPQNEPIGKPYRDLIPPGEPPDVNALRAVESGRTVESAEKKVTLADGTRLQLSVSTALLKDPSGRSIGAVEVLQDLTKIRKMEQEIARLNTLAALGEMAATIAHEVRNPLAGIGGFAALLRRDLPEDDPRQKLVSKITRGVESLNTTVTTLLNYTRTDEVLRDEVDFTEFLNTTTEQYRIDHSELARQMVFEYLHPKAAPSDPVRLAIDHTLMRQLFFNIYTNAVEACGGEGKVIITCRKLPRQTAVNRYGDRLLLGLEETIVETTITDSGSGITPDAIERVFRPFFTTKQGGTGLGLAMVWKIVKAHGGDIIAANAPEGGARFTIIMPTRIDTSAEVSILLGDRESV